MYKHESKQEVPRTLLPLRGQQDRIEKGMARATKKHTGHSSSACNWRYAMALQAQLVSHLQGERSISLGIQPCQTNLTF